MAQCQGSTTLGESSDGYRGETVLLCRHDGRMYYDKSGNMVIYCETHKPDDVTVNPPCMEVIVSRHPATVEFVRRELSWLDPRATVITGNATVADVAGKTVIGNVPLLLASYAKAVYAVEFSGQPPRGQEYTLADMDAAGAHVAGYRVIPFAV